jgi:hypothetical protein
MGSIDQIKKADIQYRDRPHPRAGFRPCTPDDSVERGHGLKHRRARLAEHPSNSRNKKQERGEPDCWPFTKLLQLES